MTSYATTKGLKQATRNDINNTDFATFKNEFDKSGRVKELALRSW